MTPKHTQHNDPFEYGEYKDESSWDFSWENDWKTIVGVVAMIVVSLVILLTTSSLADANPNRGCVASAYQASDNGFDLADNLEVCKNL